MTTSANTLTKNKHLVMIIEERQQTPILRNNVKYLDPSNITSEKRNVITDITDVNLQVSDVESHKFHIDYLMLVPESCLFVCRELKLRYILESVGIMSSLPAVHNH